MLSIAMIFRYLPIAIVLALSACQPSGEGRREVMEGGDRVQNSTSSDLERARAARIFFSHHSVGQNLLDGVLRSSAAAPGSGLELVPIERAAATAGPAWFHGSGGQNGQPESKVDYFVATIDQKRDLKPRLAFMKFCYVDFNPGSDVGELFGYYERALTQLKRDHPEIAFGHVTVPLTPYPTELKWRLYRMLGRSVWEDEANRKRQEFNRRLLERFSSDPIFDLARAESTHADGSREVFERDGETYYALDGRYAADEGHLNELGQRELGSALIRFVAQAL